jgi:hypothetical protein
LNVAPTGEQTSPSFTFAACAYPLGRTRAAIRIDVARYDFFIILSKLSADVYGEKCGKKAALYAGSSGQKLAIVVSKNRHVSTGIA